MRGRAVAVFWLVAEVLTGVWMWLPPASTLTRIIGVGNFAIAAFWAYMLIVDEA